MTAVRFRLFLTCWLVYVLHFATDFVREHYLVLSIVEDRSYALDKYFGLHVDIFKNPPEATVQGAHHGANPGISMVAAIPYLLAKPAVDWVVRRELASRQARSDTSATYQDSRPRRVEFYRNTRRLGLDIRFGLVAAITTVLCMAPLSAASVVLMYMVLGAMGLPQRRALWFALLYAFGTPLFFRTAFVNQNMAIGIFGFTAFALLWNPGELFRWSPRGRLIAAGLLGGLSFLSDYSGAIVAGLLGGYAWWRRADEVGWGRGLRESLWYALGVVPGVLLLWHYQWASFGHPLYPPQHWMAPVPWIEVGYQGVGPLSFDLLRMLLFDSRFGLLLAMPMSVLAIAAPWLARRPANPLPLREAWLCLALAAALLLFFATVQYTKLQWVTGIRYLAPLFPFLFLAAVPALLRLPKLLTLGIGIISIIISWSTAMVRSQGTIAENIERAMIGGFQLPWLNVLGKMSTQYAPWLKEPPSALPWLLLWGVVIAVVWRIRAPWARMGHP